jgi:hypothetical protein
MLDDHFIGRLGKQARLETRVMRIIYGIPRLKTYASLSPVYDDEEIPIEKSYSRREEFQELMKNVDNIYV